MSWVLCLCSASAAKALLDLTCWSDPASTQLAWILQPWQQALGAPAACLAAPSHVPIFCPDKPGVCSGSAAEAMRLLVRSDQRATGLDSAAMAAVPWGLQQHVCQLAIASPFPCAHLLPGRSGRAMCALGRLVRLCTCWSDLTST